MAITWTPTVLRVRSIGDIKEATYNVVAGGAQTYTDNGDALTFATLGMLQVEWADTSLAVDSPITGAFVVHYDIANQKVALFNSNGASPAVLLETPAATNVGTRSFRLTLHGKGPVVGPAM